MARDMKAVTTSLLRSFAVEIDGANLHGRGVATQGDRSPGNHCTPLRRKARNLATSNSDNQFSRLRIAVIDGPYSADVLSGILARNPVRLGDARCAIPPNSACSHGSFIMGLLGARADASIPGLCPDCELLHISLFADEDAAQTSVSDLALAITDAVASGASLINLSLAVLGEGGRSDEALAMALDRAEAAGAVVMAAAGNQGRLTASQILSHPVTIPVVAVDAAGHPLPESNFGPLISHKGVAALGHHVRGYAADGGTTIMSGTSVATAVATGIVAQVWSARPNVGGATMRAALAGPLPRDGPAPPKLAADVLVAKLDQILASRSTGARAALRSGRSNSLRLQGGSTMSDNNGAPGVFPGAAARYSAPRDTVAPAQGSGGCACGRENGTCTCSNRATSRLVYVLGTVDCQFPDQSVSDEFQAAADTLGIEQGQQSVRSWVHQVLTHERARRGLRYIARQISWVLKVERQPAYYLTLRDWQDLDALIACLGEPDGPDGWDLTLVAGSSSPVPVEASPGLLAPVVQAELVCAYKREQLVGWFELPAPRRGRRRAAAEPEEPLPDRQGLTASLFRRLVQLADSFGDSDEKRALNYLAVRYKPLYQLYAQKIARGEFLLTSVGVIPSRLWRDRRIVDPVFTFQRTTGTLEEKYFVRVDVTYLFPFLVNSLHLDERFGGFVPNYFDR